MSLSLVFKIQAVMFTIFGVLMLLVPGTMMESFNVGESAIAENLLQGMSILVLSVAYMSWQMPSWAGNNVKNVGMFFAIVHVAWLIMTIYQMSTGVLPSDTANMIGNIGPDLILAILFYWQSR